MESDPWLVLPVVALFALVRLWNPSFAVLAALALGLVIGLSGGPAPDLAFALPHPVFIAPEWNPGVLIGLGLPLYLVTMARRTCRLRHPAGLLAMSRRSAPR